MRTLHFTWMLLAGLLVSCQPEIRYSESGPQIDTMKRLITAIETNNLSAFEEIYADSAEIFYNTTTPVRWRQAMAGYRAVLEEFEDIKFEEGQEFEFIVTDSGEEWVSWWGVLDGKVIGARQRIRLPMHISARFEDGRIVKEAAYWDNLIVMKALEQAESVDQ